MLSIPKADDLATFFERQMLLWEIKAWVEQ
jgi:hypothetical protein